MLSINPPSERLGHENAVLTGRGSRYYVPDFEGPLSIKSVVSGTAIWMTDNRQFLVNEDCWLIVNDRQRYTITIDSARPVTTFCLFFKRGFVEEVHRVQTTACNSLLDSPQPPRLSTLDFITRIEPSGGMMQFLRRLHQELSVNRIADSEWDWKFLQVAEMLTLGRSETLKAIARVPAERHTTRMEVYRRVLRGRDFLLSSLDEPILLKDMAAAACLSSFHFHRSFRQTFGETPHQCLTRHRLQRAARLLRQTDLSVTETCLTAGFQSLTSFSHLFRSHFGVSPGRFARFDKKNFPPACDDRP